MPAVSFDFVDAELTALRGMASPACWKENMAQECKKDGPIADPSVDSFVRALDEPQRMLVILKAQLYGGQWGPMLDDLENRLEGKPYIFKLANRIKDDVERIHRLQLFEQENGVDLADYVKLES